MGKFKVPDNEYIITPSLKFPGAANEFSEKEKELIVKIPVNKFISDPENEKIFGKITDASIQDMAFDMRKSGFKGVIMAYPVDKDGERKYQIESGHRRFAAAQMVGINDIPTIITEPPTNDAERRIRLIEMNLHNRPELSPTMKANLIETLMNTNKEIRIKKGLNSDISTLLEIVSTQMELSVKSIQKYRAFEKLNPKLKELADDGVAWSALVQAGMLPEEKQDLLAFSIKSEIENSGVDNISRQWVINRIELLKKEYYDEPKKPKQKVKRRDGAKIITRCLKDFDDLMAGNASFKETDKKEAIENLKKLRDNVDKKISELSE